MIHALSPYIIVEIEDDDVRRMGANDGQARRQIRHDAKLGARPPRVPHVEPQSEKNEKRDSARDGNIGRALAALGRQGGFELREVGEQAEYDTSD